MCVVLLLYDGSCELSVSRNSLPRRRDAMTDDSCQLISGRYTHTRAQHVFRLDTDHPPVACVTDRTFSRRASRATRSTVEPRRRAVRCSFGTRSGEDCGDETAFSFRTTCELHGHGDELQFADSVGSIQCATGVRNLDYTERYMFGDNSARNDLISSAHIIDLRIHSPIGFAKFVRWAGFENNFKPLDR